MEHPNLIHLMESDLPSTKDQLSVFIYKFKEQIMNTDPLKAAIIIKSLTEIIKNVKDDEDIREHVIGEIEKYNGRVTYQGNELMLMEGGSRTTITGDKKLDRLKAKLEATKIEIKAREQILKAGGGNKDVVIKTTSTTTFKVMLK